MQITDNTSPSNTATGNALFNLGFRAFFLGAGIFSIISISLWALVFIFQLPLAIESISTPQWHAHEMIFGYSLAVIAGFLLTAVKNWTGVPTLYGKPLMLLFGLWCAARLLFMLGTSYLLLAAIFDILFSLFLILAIARPIAKAKQWKQLFILSILILLCASNVMFYLGALNIIDNVVSAGIYAGLYTVIGLILIMGRRVVPFFIETGVDDKIKLFNSNWIDITIILLFIAFFISEILQLKPALSSYLALGLFIVNAIRLIGWHTPGIWTKSLLWSIYLAFCFICLGFLLFAGIHFFGASKFLALHAFAVGGIGVITMGMMSRVALGHTGRGVNNPPKVISYAFGILLLAAVFRVIVPLFITQHPIIWIGLSQVLWIIAFLIFVVTYLPILIKPRIDGQAG